MTEAPDGLSDLKTLTGEPHDLLMVDYAMLSMNSAEVITRVRAIGLQLPVIHATGYADTAEVGRVLGTQSILISLSTFARCQRQ